jgi:hypothetical protein
VALAGLTILGVRLVTGHRPTPSPGCTVAALAGSGAYSLTPDQAQNAAIIAAVALRKGMVDHAVTIALAASLQETQLRNLPYGDRDSVGLFQQRPSQGWGATAQILDPNYAASAFYDHLALVSGWQTMAVTTAAQLVQHSAAPDAYAAWEPEARSLASALTGEVPAGLACRVNGFGGPVPAPGALTTAATTELGGSLLGVPLSAKAGWQVATWAVAHAYAYHVSSVTFAGWRWTAASSKWTAPAGTGATDTRVVVG